MIETPVKFGFRYLIEHLDANGNLIDSEIVDNVVPYNGSNYLLGAAINGVTPATTWKLGLYANNYTCLVSDTLATFISAASEVTAYTVTGGSAVNREAYTPDAIASGAITNSATPGIFTFTGPATVYGGFLTSSIPKSDTTGYLMSAVKFSASKSMLTTEQLRVTAGLTLTST